MDSQHVTSVIMLILLMLSLINDSIMYNDIYEEPYAQGLQVSDAWLNRSETGDETLLHTHPWSIISGVLYITGDDGSTVFVQNNPYDTVNQMSMPKRYHIKQECPIANGTMIMFPSTLQHFVPVNRSREASHLSFNTMPSAVDDGHPIRALPTLTDHPPSCIITSVQTKQ